MTKEPLNRRDWIAGLEKGLAILEAFDHEHPRLTPTQAAELTGLTRTAARRYLLTLEHLGYLTSEGTLFSLTPRVLKVGWSYFDSARLPRTVQPFLQRDRLFDEIRKAGRQDYAVVEQQLQIGVRGVAVPLRDRHGNVIAALSVNMQVGEETTEHALQRVLQVLQDTALSIMRVL